MSAGARVLDLAPVRRPCRTPSSPCSWRRCSSAAWPAATWPARWPSVTAGPLLEVARADRPRSRITASGELASALGDPDLALAHFLQPVGCGRPRRPAPELLPWRAGAALAPLRRGAPRGRRAGRAAPRGTPPRVAPYAIALALRTLATIDTGRRPGRTAARARESWTAYRPTGWSPRSTPTSPGSWCSPRCRTARGARAAPRGRGLRRAPGAVAAAGPGTPAARPPGRGAAADRQRGDGLADRGRAPGGGARRRGPDQPADRRAAPGERQGGRVAPLERLPQAGIRSRKLLTPSAPPPDPLGPP